MSQPTLIVFASRYGTCRRIAHRVASHAKAAGIEHLVHDLASGACVVPPGTAHVVLIGAVYSNQHHDVVQAFLKSNADALAAARGSLISVSLAAAIPTEEGEQMALDYADELMRLTGWKPKDVLFAAGSIDNAQYDEPTAALLSVASWRRQLDAAGKATDGDRGFTDWPALDGMVKRWFTKR
jgi:menaquinone-dependent protoporphyrinogen IX oxidase